MILFHVVRYTLGYISNSDGSFLNSIVHIVFMHHVYCCVLVRYIRRVAFSCIALDYQCISRNGVRKENQDERVREEVWILRKDVSIRVAA
jgi:hypothetical protein